MWEGGAHISGVIQHTYWVVSHFGMELVPLRSFWRDSCKLGKQFISEGPWAAADLAMRIQFCGRGSLATVKPRYKKPPWTIKMFLILGISYIWGSLYRDITVGIVVPQMAVHLVGKSRVSSGVTE